LPVVVVFVMAVCIYSISALSGKSLALFSKLFLAPAGEGDAYKENAALFSGGGV
jgi:hypothetical protein